jgi:hypothetical protein
MKTTAKAVRTAEEIRVYTESQLNETVRKFKYHRKKQGYWDEDSPFHKEHWEYMLEYKEQTDTLKNVLNFITGSEDAFFALYQSIND